MTTLLRPVVVEEILNQTTADRLDKRNVKNSNISVFLQQFNSYCGKNPSLRPANPSDLNIVCSEWDVGPVSESLSLEDEVVLQVSGYLNHPMFNITVGPIGT